MTKREAEAPPAAAPVEHEASSPDDALLRLLDQVESPAPTRALAAPELAPALRTAQIVSVAGDTVQIAFRGRAAPVAATLDTGVDRALVERALAQGDRVLVEIDPEVGPVVVGVVQTRLPQTLELKANKVVIEAESEVLLRSGTAAVRLREDGEVEMVGSRITSVSRGLYRIVGRILRLN